MVGDLQHRGSQPQITCTLEKLVYKDKQVSSDIKGYENKEYLLGWWNW